MESYSFLDPRPSAIYRTMDLLNENFGFIEKKQFGKSVLLQPMVALFMGCGKNTLFICAGQHSNEYLGTLALLRFIFNLAEAYAKNGIFFGFEPKKILSQMRFCFVPLANPDGLSLVIGELSSGSYFAHAKEIASHYSAIPFTAGWKANIQGVDLNLQYPAGWDNARKIKSKLGFGLPAPMNFPGTAPLSAPESIAVAELVTEISPKMLIALHSQGRVIYGQRGGSYPTGSDEFSKKLSAISSYPLEKTPAISDNAGIKDWFIEQFNRSGYTIELGLGQNPLSLDQLDRVYADLAPMLMLAATEISGTL